MKRYVFHKGLVIDEKFEKANTDQSYPETVSECLTVFAYRLNSRTGVIPTASEMYQVIIA